MIKQSISIRLPIYMTDAVGVAITGLAFGDVVVKYAKAGENSLTTKTIIASPVEWIELGQGLYDIVFTTDELDTVGFFKYLVTGTGAIQSPGLVDIAANLVEDVKTDTAAILVDTGNIETKVDAVKVDTAAILVLVGTIDGKVDDIDGNVDSILVDTNETQEKLPAATIAGEAEATVNKDSIETKIDALIAQNDTTFIGD